MTREEAKEIIKNIDYAYRSFRSHEYEALEMAIKALEQEFCEDCISRQAVIDAFKKWQPYMATRIHEFENELNELPTVQPKTGHWIRELIRNEKGGCIGAKMICSECGNDNKHDEYMKYCPNCRSKMKEGD